MTSSKFSYAAVFESQGADRITSIIAYLEPMNGPLRAVIWNLPRQMWMFAPAPAARLLYDDRYFGRTRDLDRAGAEEAADEALGSSLPAEDELDRMCDEGSRVGWRYGPPETEP